jgi:hypothetical protein
MDGASPTRATLFDSGARTVAHMPIGAQDSLQKLYDRQQLLSDEATRREDERDQLEESDQNPDRYYILEIEIAALRQESSRISARIADLLERDLQR